nr:MAG TPA: hypothetical protein [Caudoviricetes sp.]
MALKGRIKIRLSTSRRSTPDEAVGALTLHTGLDSRNSIYCNASQSDTKIACSQIGWQA